MEKKFAQDEQTGKMFELIKEVHIDIVAAIISVLYLISMLGFFTWLLLDISTGKNQFLSLFFPKIADEINTSLYQLIAYTAIGGGLGGVVNGIRGFIVWHAERRAFGWRFLWKYITLPLLGVILAAMVYAILRGGIAAFGGDFAPSESFATQALSAFAIGSLAGYGSHKVFRWLDEQVNKLFKIAPIAEVKVPNLIGSTKEEAEALLKEANLNLGKVDKKVSTQPEEFDKIIEQNPSADSVIPKGRYVDIVIATKS